MFFFFQLFDIWLTSGKNSFSCGFEFFTLDIGPHGNRSLLAFDVDMGGKSTRDAYPDHHYRYITAGILFLQLQWGRNDP